MTNMQFPCEIATLDDVLYPRGYEVVRVPLIQRRLPQKPLHLVQQVYKKLSGKTPNKIPLEHVEYQQPYLISTSEIPFMGADLRNTLWAGTKLNRPLSKLGVW
jgi:hypothetical protein